MPKNINDIIWYVFIGLISLMGGVSIPLIKNWIISIIDKRLETINKEIENIKNYNQKFREEFFNAINELKTDIKSINATIEKEFLKFSLKLEKDFVQKIDCTEYNKDDK